MRKRSLYILLSVAVLLGLYPGLAFAVAGHDAPLVAQTDGTYAMYRLYNPTSGEHFYTASEAERDAVEDAGWNYEGIGWYAPEWDGPLVYRLYSGTDHHYTTSEAERDSLVKAGWSYEGVGWTSDETSGFSVPLYRQFNPNVDPTAPVNNSGSHNYTTSLSEHNQLVSVGWHDEGVGWYGVDVDAYYGFSGELPAEDDQ